MSNYVDERIVEMKFDNQDFEKNVKVSMKTLEDLNKSLKLEDAGKSFDSISKASSKIDLSTLSNNIQAVADRFSFMGIVGDQVIRRLTDGFISLGQAVMSTVKSLTIDQVGVGFDKYERKIQSVQTIMNATGKTIDEVSESLDKLNWYTDETSYSYSDMVDNISKFTNANVPLETAVTSMIGIANAAGLAGASVSDASHAMEGFSKAIAQGYMDRRNWQWVKTAHMDTTKFKEILIQTAVAQGTLTAALDGTYHTAEGTAVSIADFESALKDGWVTTEVINKALGEFGGTAERVYEEYMKLDGAVTTSQIIEQMGVSAEDLGLKAFRAAQEAKTFSDAINAVKDAVSTGWMTSFEKIFGNYEEARHFWTDVANDLWDLFASSGETRNNILDAVFGKDSIAQMKSQLSKAGISAEQFEDSLQKVGLRRYGNIDNLIHQYGSLTEALRAGAITGDLAKQAMLDLAGGMSTTSTETVDLNKKLEEVKKKVHDVIEGVYGNGEARRKALTELGDSYEYIQGLVNKILIEGKEITLDDVKIFEQEIENITELSEEQRAALLAFVNGTEDAEVAFDELMATISRKSGQELVHEMVLNIIEALNQMREIGTEAFDNIFGSPEERAEALYTLVEKLHELTEQLELSDDAADNLRKTFEGLFSVFKIISTTIGYIFTILSPFKDLFDLSRDSILEFTGSVGESITEFSKWYETSEEVASTVNRLRGYVARLVDVLRKVIGFVRRLANTYLPPIKEAISGIVDSIESSRIGKYLKDAKKWVKDLWSQIENFDFDSIKLNTEGVADFIGGLVDAIISLYNTIKNFLAPYIEDVKKLFTDFRGTIQPLIDRFTGLKTKVSEAGGVFGFIGQKLSDLWSKIKDFKSNGGLSALFEGFLDGLEPIKDGVKNFIEDIGKKLDEIDWGRVLAFTIGFSTVPAILSISAAFTEASKLFKSGRFVFDNINTILYKFKTGFKSTVVEIGKAAIEFSIAIAILAGAIWLLAEKTDPQKLKQATTSLMEITIAFGAIALLVGIVSKMNADMPKALGSMLAFAAGIAVLSGALFVLQQVKFDWALIGRLVIMLGMMAALFAVALGLSKLGVKLEGVGLYFLTFAGAILILSMAMERISNIETKSLDQAMQSILLLMVGLGVVTTLAKSMKGGAIGLIGLIGSIFITLKLLEKLKEVSPTTIINTLTKFWGLFAGFLVMLIGFAILSAIAGKEASGLGIAMLGITASLLIVYEAIKLFGELSVSTLTKGGIIVGAVLLIFAVLAKASSHNFGKAAQLGVTIAAMSASLLLVYWAVKAFSSLDASSLSKGLGAIIIIFGMYAALLATSALSGKAKTGPIVAMALVLAALIGGLAFLSIYSWDDLKSGVFAMSAVIGALAALFAVIGALKINNSSLGPMIVGVLTLGVIGAALFLLADKPWSGLLAAMASISVCLLAVAAAIRIINGVSFDGSALGAFAAGLVGVWFIGWVLKGMADLPWDSMLSAAASIAIVLVSVAAAIRIMDGIKPGNAAMGAGGLLAAIVILGAGLYVLGFVCELLKLKESTFKKGIAICGYIGDALGQLVGGFLAGINTSIFDTLPVLGEDLSAFMENAEGFFDGVKDMPDGLGSKLAGLAVGLTALLAENVLADIMSIFRLGGSPFQGLTADLTELGKGLKAFVENGPTGAQAEAAKSSVPVMESIVKIMNSIPKSGGIADWFGKKDLSGLGTNLESFGTSLGKYAVAVTGLNTTAISDSMTAVDNVIHIANQIPSSGGIVGVFTGNTDWSAINNNLATFGQALSDYSTKVNGLKVEPIENSVKAAEFIGQVAESLPKSNGVVQWWNGEVSWDTFAQSLNSYVNALINFGSKAAVIDYDSIERLANFEGLGKALSISLASGLDSSGIDFQVALIRIIVNARDSAERLTKDFMIIGADISASIANGFASNFSIVISTVNNKGNDLRAEFEKIVNMLPSAFNNNAGSISQALSTYIGSCISRIRGYYSSFSSAGVYIMTGLRNGMTSVYIAGAAGSVVSSSASTIRGYYNSFYNAGYYLVYGLRNGIIDYTYLATSAVAAMAIRMNNTFRAYNAIQSPSKLYAKSASYIPMGVAKGIEDNSSVADNAIEGMGYDMITAISPALDLLARLVNGEFEFSPTIRPVVDMDDVYANAEVINGLFDTAVDPARSQTGYISRGINISENARRSMDADKSSASTFSPVINNYIYTQPGQDTAAIADEVERRMVRSLTQRKVAFVNR